MYKHSKMFISAAVVAAAMAPLGAQAPQTVPLQSVRDSGYLMFRSPDGAFAYWLDGRVQIDAAVYKGGNTHLASGTDVRRARMGWKATMFKNWHGEMDVDFAENGVDMKDMWIGYEGFKNQLLKVGNFREPFSLETMTSSKYITFLERSYIDNFSPDRRMGMSYTRWGNWYQTSVGLFGQEIGTVDATAASEGWAMTGRFVASPIHQDGKVVHVGLALSRRTPDAAAGVDTHTVRFRARPETDLSKVRFLTTGKVRGVDHTSYYNFEFSSVYGPFTLQSEYTRVALRKLVDTLDSPTFDGFYVTGSWFLTGETRPYLMEEGEYGRIFPKHESGAWELAARLSSMDLNDFRPQVNIKGGKAVNATLGVNWYINANFKYMLNVVRVQNDKNAKPDFGIAPLLPGPTVFTIVQTRFALAF